MKDLMALKETVDFMGHNIPIIEGGFGEDCRILTAHMISEIHDILVGDLNRLTSDNIEEFEEGIDVLNLLSVGRTHSEINSIFNLNIPNNAKAFYIYSEQGYIALVNLMRSERAREIRKTIRRDYFNMKAEIKAYKIPRTYSEALFEAGRLALENEKLTIENEEKTKLLEEQAPKIEFVDRLLKTKDNVLLRNFCVAIYNEGLKIGQNRLFIYLRENKIFYKSNGSNFPYQKYIDSGYFVVEEKPSNNIFYNELTFTPKITPKGQIWLYNKLRKEFGEEE